MVDEFGEISREAGTCGMHVHVGIESREEGIGIIDRMRPWLPAGAGPQRQLALRRGPRQRVRVVAVPGLVPLAHGRRDGALR
jgi:hypothetical protein